VYTVIEGAEAQSIEGKGLRERLARPCCCSRGYNTSKNLTTLSALRAAGEWDETPQSGNSRAMTKSKPTKTLILKESKGKNPPSPRGKVSLLIPRGADHQVLRRKKTTKTVD